MYLQSIYSCTPGIFVDDKKLKRKQFIVGVHKIAITDREFEIVSSPELRLLRL